MKRILSVALVFILVMSSLLLVACEDKSDEPAATTASSTIEAEDNGANGAKPADPVKVEDVNGMTAIELFQNCKEEYDAASTYDVKMIMESTESGVTAREEVIIKLGADTAYLKMNMDGSIREYWGIGGYVYCYAIFDGESQKVKIEGKLTSFLGDVINTMLTIPFEKSDMTAEYLAEVEDAELYFYAGQYYYTVSLVETEDGQEITTKETFYFNAQGELTKVVTEDDADKLTAIINSYGKPVSVKAPMDIDSFVDMDEVGGGNGDEDAFTIYDKAFELIESAEIYSMGLSENDVTCYNYGVDQSSNEYIVLFRRNDIYEHYYYVNGRAFIADSEYVTREVEITDDILNTFKVYRSAKDAMLSARLDRSEIAEITLIDDSNSPSFYSVNVVRDTGDDNLRMSYTINVAKDYSQVIISYLAVGGDGVTYRNSYWINNINDPDLNIPDPSLWVQ